MIYAKDDDATFVNWAITDDASLRVKHQTTKQICQSDNKQQSRKSKFDESSNKRHSSFDGSAVNGKAKLCVRQ